MRNLGTFVGPGSITFGTRTFRFQLSKDIPDGIDVLELNPTEVREIRAEAPDYKEITL